MHRINLWPYIDSKGMRSSKDSLWKKKWWCVPLIPSMLPHVYNGIVPGNFFPQKRILFARSHEKEIISSPSKYWNKQVVEFFYQVWSNSTDFSRFAEFTPHLSNTILHLVHNGAFLVYSPWLAWSFRKKTTTNFLLIMQVHKIQEALKLSTVNNFTTSDETILRQRVCWVFLP